ncbi:MAG: sigma factor-like helix-turn-helix DNA-binding protein [Patescibacteria group bacterium]
MPAITFKPKQVTKHLLSVLPERARDVMMSRYGLGKDPERMTLEAIGKKYNITRERVRQIENHAIATIRKSKEYQKEKKAFEELEVVIHDLGGLITEDDLLNHITKDKTTHNHLNILLILGESFKKRKEDEHFNHRWFIDEELSDKVHGSLHKLFENLSDTDLISEGDIISTFADHLKEVADEYKQEEILKRWLALSKAISRNPLGEWGKASSSNVNAKGMRDYAFLVIRKHGSPIHFTEVAKQIEKLFKKKAHVATTHNELIKDPRFVLVGRGLYALSEWGYISGVVKDVIKKVIEQNGPLPKDKIIDKVLKERYVKENTIMVNLQNPKFFKKDKEGRYSLS